MVRIIWVIVVWAVLAGAGAAEGLFAARQPLFDMPKGAKGEVQLASLFVDEAEGGLFAALPGRLDAPLRRGDDKAARLHDLISRAEAGAMGYDAVQHGARVKPPKRPTRMTLGEIYAWIRATPGQPHAIGRYQFIPATLRHSAKRLRLPPETRFSPEVQDQLANLLLGDAGFLKVQAGEITAETFMLNLAKIWAGLPLPSGRSYYQGYAGNKATMDYAVFAREVRAILEG
jgi:muramidase (phage lysozyme)